MSGSLWIYRVAGQKVCIVISHMRTFFSVVGISCGQWVLGCGQWDAESGQWVPGCVPGCEQWVLGCGQWVLACRQSMWIVVLSVVLGCGQ